MFNNFNGRDSECGIARAYMVAVNQLVKGNILKGGDGVLYRLKDNNLESYEHLHGWNPNPMGYCFVPPFVVTTDPEIAARKAKAEKLKEEIRNKVKELSDVDPEFNYELDEVVGFEPPAFSLGLSHFIPL